MPRPSNRPTWRPHLTLLEDRTTPVTISGNTVTLDDVGERLLIFTATAGTYTLTSSTDGTQTFTPAAGTVTVIDSAAGTGVEFGNSSADYAHSFAVTLDDAPGEVSFFGLASFGANDLTVTTTRNILVKETAFIPGRFPIIISTIVSATSGNITFSANQQATPTSGNFVGVEVQSGLRSANGAVSVSGRGGTAPVGSQIGVRVNRGGNVSSDGNVSVTGTGGASTGDDNYGVQVMNNSSRDTQIISDGGNVTVTGVGGGVQGTTSLSYSNTNRGVFVNLGGQITAGGTGAVSVTGTGGKGGLGLNAGVYVTDSGSVITSRGGGVSVTGTGGGNGLNDAFDNHGVIVAAGGKVTAGGGGAVSVSGRGNTGGINAGSLGNVGVFVTGSGSAVTSGGGPVNIEGVDGTYVAVAVQEGGTIASAANAPVTVTTDTLEVIGTGTISAGTGTVTLQTLTPGAFVTLGGNDNARHYPTSFPEPLSLGLKDSELDRVTAGTLVIGRSTTANIRLVAPVTRPTVTPVQLISAGYLRSEFDGRFDTAGDPLTLTVGGDIIPDPAGNDYAAGTITVASGARLALAFNTGTTPTRLDVTGTLDLNGLSLVLSGNRIPTVGNVFTLATATAITGTFTGLPDGATVTLNGATLRVNYTATTVTATAIGTSLQPRLVTAVGDVVRVLNPADGSTRTLVPFPGFNVSVAAADLNNDGVPDVIIGAGPGGGPHVRAFDGATSAELASFFAFDVSFRGGVNVAAGGGFVALGAGAGGGPHVKVVAANQLNSKRADGVIADSVAVANFFAFDVAFAGGVSVALGDVNTDGTADLVVGAGAGGGPHVKVIDGTKWSHPRAGVVIDDTATVASFFAFDTSFTGGVNVAATAGRFAVGAGAGGEPQVKVYRVQGGPIEERNDRAFDATFRGGVRVGFADIDADGDVDLLTAAGPGGGPHLKAFNVAPFGLVRSEFVGDPTDTRGVVV